MDDWDQRMIELVRKGGKEKARYLENDLKRHILPTQLERIRQNDKTVLKELVLPPWLDWGLLYEWSIHHRQPVNGVECILCNKTYATGIEFNDKFVCDECLFKLRTM